jgi:hypothetical protein
MDDQLEKLLQMAKADPTIKKRLLDSRNEKDPLSAFCNLCQEYGFDISVGQLVAMGEDFCDTMIRSVNGGGVNAPYGQWDDMYDMFMTALEF